MSSLFFAEIRSESAFGGGPVVGQELAVQCHDNAVAGPMGFLRHLDTEIDRAHNCWTTSWRSVW